ncbi:uncharacterized protein [Halyomorpha halys]|uniref:uncharacterized protein n=1 Tax=Halyomorpha halys TaxID=286706 RepID=UPI0034D2A740
MALQVATSRHHMTLHIATSWHHMALQVATSKHHMALQVATSKHHMALQVATSRNHMALQVTSRHHMALQVATSRHHKAFQTKGNYKKEVGSKGHITCYKILNQFEVKTTAIHYGRKIKCVNCLGSIKNIKPFGYPFLQKCANTLKKFDLSLRYTLY